MVHRIIETMYFLFEYLQQPNALRINQCSLHAISSSWAEVAYRYVAPTNVADRSMTGPPCQTLAGRGAYLEAVERKGRYVVQRANPGGVQEAKSEYAWSRVNCE
jgi:hypothetical protein